MMDSTFAKLDTQRPADCVESCPFEGFEDIVVCGTYHLQESNDRAGNFHIYQLIQDINGNDIQVNNLKTIELDTGIFDMKWCHQKLNGDMILTLATALGDLRCYKLNEDTKILTLLDSSQKSEIGQLENTSMFLSLDWNNRVYANIHPKVAVSQSNSNLSIWAYSNGAFTPETEWRAHDLYGSDIEVWITAFNYHHPDILFSGGDDAILKGWDLRMDPTHYPTFQNRRCHSMGVCSIQFNPFHDHVLATGSYDESIHLWDDRNMKEPISTFHTGGGVWRIKWNPKIERSSYVATACMHNGFQILNSMLDMPIEGEEGMVKGSWKQSASYDHHESLAYGIDWWYNPTRLISKNPVLASCSFYDKSFQLWERQIG